MRIFILICSKFLSRVVKLFLVNFSCILGFEFDSVDKMEVSFIRVLLKVNFFVMILDGKGYEFGNSRDRWLCFFWGDDWMVRYELIIFGIWLGILGLRWLIWLVRME